MIPLQGTASVKPAPLGLSRGVPPARPASAPVKPEILNPGNPVAFYAALALIFLRFSLLHETVAFYTGTNTYILYLFAIPALLGVVLTGGVQRTLAARPAKYWLAFVFWLFLTVPFSFWRGESASYALNYLRTDLPMLFVMAGLALTWKEFKAILYTISGAGIFSIFTGLFLSKEYGSDRLGLASGTFANPNDYAGHLLILLPLLLFLVLNPPQILLGWVFRVGGAVAILVGLYVTLMSASRGALVALVVGSVFVILKSRASVRIAALVLLPILAFALIRVLPEQTLARLQNISISDQPNPEDGIADPASTEAEGSARARRFLLQESIRVTLEHPLFGVGPGQFAAVEGRATGWHSTHNSFTQISSECGIPALVFFLAGIFSAFRLLLRVWKQARYRPDMQEVVTVCYCLSLSFVMFLTAIFFLNFGYVFYLPAFTGLFIALWRVAGQDLAAFPALTSARVPSARPSAAKATLTAIPAPAPLSPPRKTFRFNRYR